MPSSQHWASAVVSVQEELLAALTSILRNGGFQHPILFRISLGPLNSRSFSRAHTVFALLTLSPILLLPKM